MAASEIYSLVFNDDVTHDASNRMYSEVYGTMLSGNLQKIASKQDNDSRHNKDFIREET